MKARFNDTLLLWAIGVMQPASVGDALAFIREIFPQVSLLPSIKDLTPTIDRWLKEGYIVRVHGKSRLYSLTLLANTRMPVSLRRHRDKARLFLLHSVRRAKVHALGEARQRLAGESPAVDSSSGIQEGSRPINSAESPREPRPIGRIYWPRIIKQLEFKVGSAPRSPNTSLAYYSFPSANAVRAAGKGDASPNDMSITDLALAIGVSARLLTAFTHRPANHYRQFEIGRRGGGKRQINSPKVFLKVVQYWILDYLLWRLPVHESSHAYKPMHSIITNATPHVGQNYVANIDIEDFFGSIQSKQIEDLLREAGFGPLLAHQICRLTTLDGSLPQGAPTSPCISNAYLYDFDSQMHQYVTQRGLKYTRYADDITISGANRDQVAKAISVASAYLKNQDLRLNHKKTRVASQSGQQKVTGVVVNRKAQPPRVLRRRIRAMFHQANLAPERFAEKYHLLAGYCSYLNSYPELRGGKELSRYRLTLRKIAALKKEKNIN